MNRLLPFLLLLSACASEPKVPVKFYRVNPAGKLEHKTGDLVETLTDEQAAGKACMAMEDLSRVVVSCPAQTF